MIVYDIMNKITIISLITHICAYLVEYCRVVSLEVTMKFQKKTEKFPKICKSYYEIPQKRDISVNMQIIHVFSKYLLENS